ncbi:hypothetical protein AB205_0113590 [Aquarana catesbeiana]|uniref:Uncharacterized protein n=1 Tax=Aquarana catesbeiana TaxID=8400 RepID=A0A2G9RWG7_AQUCT|nr:hypothetical protein AB205_0113590 [Aquarana catesbeiana]
MIGRPAQEIPPALRTPLNSREEFHERPTLQPDQIPTFHIFPSGDRPINAQVLVVTRVQIVSNKGEVIRHLDTQEPHLQLLLSYRSGCRQNVLRDWNAVCDLFFPVHGHVIATEALQLFCHSDFYLSNEQ